MFNIAVLATVLGVANCALIRPVPLTDGRIVGGQEVTIEEYPYQVSLQYFGSHICGGTILSTRRVLTAAHCTDGMSSSYLTVRAGSTYQGSGGQVVNVDRIIQNPQYNPSNMDNDISILELDSPLTLGAGVQPASVDASLPSDGTVAVVSGWGALSEGGSPPSALHAVEVNIVTPADCKAAYGSSAISSNMLCAQANGKDSCQGDSGGPLVIKGTSTLVGVVSWGYGCARPDYPGVYASVPNLRSWIDENM